MHGLPQERNDSRLIVTIAALLLLASAGAFFLSSRAGQDGSSPASGQAQPVKAAP